MSETLVQSKKNRFDGPISVGAGFLALDWLLIGSDRVRPNEAYAGGSCGNVMSILAFLGWNSYPVARLGRDSRSEQVMADLRRFNVHTDFVVRKSTGTTPIIIVRIREQENGEFTRRFEWKHPSSGEWLPRYRPFPKTMAMEVSDQLPSAKIFYFDRAEPSSLLLAKAMQKQGAVVFFEPSSTHNLNLFSECLAVSDIVKYSSDRLPNPPQNPQCKSPRLEIQTLGELGLRFRLKMGTDTPGPWRHLEAYKVKESVDSTGCGDWCSAGLINQLCQNGRDEFFKLGENTVENALQFGQALAAINCKYMGARAPMYKLDRASILAEANRLVANT